MTKFSLLFFSVLSIIVSAKEGKNAFQLLSHTYGKEAQEILEKALKKATDPLSVYTRAKLYPTQKKDLCALFSGSEINEPDVAYFALYVAENQVCKLPSKPSEKLLEQRLNLYVDDGNARGFGDLYWVVGALRTMKAKKSSKKFGSLFELLLGGINESTGLIAESSSVRASWGATATSLAILNLLYEDVNPDDAQKEKLEIIVEKLFTANELSLNELDVLSLSILVEAYVGLKKKLGFTPIELTKPLVAALDFLIAQAASTADADSGIVLSMLQQWPGDLFSFSVSPVSSDEKGVRIAAEFCNVLGDKIDIDDVKVTVKQEKKELQLTDTGDCKFEGLVEAAKLDKFLKKYPLGKFHVTIQGKKHEISRSWKAKYIAEFSHLTVAAGTTRTGAVEIYNMQKKNDEIHGKVLDDTQILFFEIKVMNVDSNDSVSPHQVAIGFHYVGDAPPLGLPQTKMLYVTPNEGGTMTFALPLSTRKMILPYSGEYEVSVIAADSKMEKPLREVLGTVALKFSNPVELTMERNDKPSVVPAVQGTDVEYFGPQDLKFHTFREPEKRPNGVISLVFMIMIIVVFVLYIFVLFQLFNVGMFDFSRYSGYGFMGLMCFVVCLLWQFYFTATLAETAMYLSPLLVSGIFIGNAELSRIKQDRWTQTTKALKDDSKKNK